MEFFRSLLALSILFASSLTAAPIDQKLVVIGSSVPRGFGAYTAGSFLGQDVDGNGSPDSFAVRGYAGLIKSYVEANGWTFDNQSLGGDSTDAVLSRFAADVVSENPEFVLIGLSLGNEGLTFTKDPESVLESFRSGMLQIIQECRDEGYYPIVGLAYPNQLYTLDKYEYVKRMNLIMNTWDVPSINLLGAIDDGDGKWAHGFRFDNAHPNVPGHEELYHAVVPTLFDAIDQGQTAVPTYPSSNAFLRITQDVAQAAPITYTPNETLRAFTTSFKVRSGVTGTVAAVRLGAEPLFLIDFGPSDDANGRATTGADVFGNYWNSWRPAVGGASISTGTTLSNLVTVDSTATTVSLEVTDAFSGSNGILGGGLDGADGPNAAQIGTLAVETATEDYFFETGTGAFKLTGLDPTKRYTLRFFGTRQSTVDRETRFTVTGAMSYSPFAYITTSGENIGSNRSYDGNDDSIVMISGVEPTVGGEIAVTVAPEVGDFAYLGLMEVLLDDTGTSDRFAAVELRDTELAYVAPDGREIIFPMDADDGSWHEVALSHAYARQETLLFVDGALVGRLRETLEPDLFILGGSGSAGSDSPASADYQDWAVYRAPWTEGEAMAQQGGALQQASMEICAALDDGSFSNGVAVDNRAQSLSTAVINTASVSAPTAINPPGFLSALSTAADAVELSWIDNSSTESGFVLERRAFDEGEAWTTVASVGTDATGYINTGLTKGIRYSYRLSSSESGLQSGYSNVAMVSVGENGTSYRAWISDYYDLQPATYLIDFNTSTLPNYGSEIWNTVSSLSASTVYPLVDTNNDGAAGYTVRLLNGFDQFRSANGNPLAGYDDDAQRTLFVSTKVELGEAVIVLSGLDPEQHYDLGIFARREVITTGFDYVGRYTITGAEGEVVYDFDNATSADLVEILSIRPDAGGSISIRIDPTDIAAGTYFAGINFLTLKEVRRPYLIDFNSVTSPSYTSGETWNTINSPSNATPYTLVDADGNATEGYTLTLSSPFSTTREGDGKATAGGVIDFTAESNLFALTGNLPTAAELRIGGLDTSRSYEIAFLAKRNGANPSFDYSGIYTVTGAGAPVALTIDGADNTEYTIISGVVPDSNGEIVLGVAPNGDAATVTNDFPVINLMRVSIDGAATGDLPAADSDQDSDADGAINFLEYSLDRDPTADDDAPVTFDAFSLNAAATNATFQYSRFSRVQGISFEVQHTIDLANPDWQPISGASAMTIGSSGTLDLIEVQATISGDTGFFRLSITD